MAINLRQVWRVGSSWGGFPIIEFFREKQIVFFGRDSSRLGHYYEAKVGDLLAITKPNSKKVVAVARMESTFTGLSSWSIGYQNSICKYCNGKSDNIIICNATIIDIISDDYFDCSDYKRFYNMGHHEKINELWKRYFEENKSEIKERGWFYLRQLGTGLNFIKIPPVQRGLVWKPRQIELLWDSILRRFPIGSTIMYLNENGFELLDGQQRQNAIRIGYSNIYNNEIRLWLDLGIKNISSRYSKRKYWVRAITKAHPWGFQLNDECTPLSAGERRNALRDFGYDEGATISNCDINLDKCWPYVGSVCPIPLDIVFKHADKDVEAFTKGCIEDCKGLPLFITNAISSYPNIWEQIHTIVHTIGENKIPFSLLLSDALEDDAEEDDAEELEVLFGRITSGGTPITTAELNYSAIKVYWPNVRVICDKVSEKCMPAHFLALMVFRLYILESSKGKWQTDVSISTIRKLRENKESITDVELLFKRVEKLVDCVDSWLLNHNNGVPKVIRSDIAINHPDLYLFLLWLADKYPDKFESEYITALTCFIKWFSKEPIETIKHLYSSLQGTDFSKEVVLSILYDIKASSENIIWPCSLTEYDNLKLLMYSSFSPHWNSSQHIQDVAYETWAKVRTNPWDFPDMLIYAQRDYFNTNFSKYDASNKKLWDSHNRPWDYDHIMPKDWIYKQRNGEWREFDNIWLNDVGNLAAIPFELNRSKGNESDWKYYEENQDELMYEDTSSISTNIRFRESESKKFAINTLVRTGRIYAKVFALINEVISDNIDISHTSCYINYRKKFLESLSQKCKSIGFNTSITIPNISGLEQVISNSSKRSDWASKEIFLNIDCINQEYVVSLSLNASKRNSITMGIRISPNHLVLEQSVFESLRHLNSTSEYYENSNRWYLYRSVSINDSEEHIHEEIEKIIKLFEPAFLAQIKTLPIENNNA